MLARTVVHLAESPDERGPGVGRPAAQKQRGRSMSLVDTAESWLAAHYDDLVAWRRHFHRYPPPELGPSGIRHHAIRRRAAGRRRAEPQGAARRHRPDLRLSAPSKSRASRCAPTWTRCRWPSGTGAPYASTMPNVAHACGHDAHTAILLGTALALASVPELPMGVRLIFQAAEELMPGGAIDAIAAGALTGVSRIFALHCDPRLEVGKVAVRLGPITSAADQLEITLYSPGGHTSRPHLTADLVYGLGTLITGLPGVLSRRLDPRNSTVLVWGAVNAGVAPNAIPQTGVLAGNRAHCQPAYLGRPRGDDPRRRHRPAVTLGHRAHAAVPGAACRPWSMRTSRHASSPTPSKPSARMCWPIPDSPAAARTSPGIWRKFPVPWPVWVSGRARDSSSTYISRRSTSTRRALGVGVRVMVNIIEQSRRFSSPFSRA